MFMLFENAIQGGDLVTFAGLSGRIEQLLVRTIWQRAADAMCGIAAEMREGSEYADRIIGGL